MYDENIFLLENMDILNKFFRSIFFAPVLTGALLALALPYSDIGFLALIAFVPMLFFVNLPHISTKKVFWGGFLSGTIYGIFVLYPLFSLNAWWWVNQEGFFWIYKDNLLRAFLVLLASYGGGLFFAIFFGLYRKFKQNSILDAFVFSLIWAVMEWVREFFVLGFTWGHLGYLLHNHTYVLQLAKIAGVYGVSFFVVVVNILIYLVLFRSHTSKEKIHRSLILSTFLVVILLYGYFIVSVGDKNLNKKELSVAVVNQTLKTEESIGISGYYNYINLLKEALAKKPDIVVLPENAFPFFIIERTTMLPFKYNNPDLEIGRLYDELALLSKDNPKSSFIMGMHTQDKNERYNSLVVMENGLIVGIYNKQELLPLAENSPEIGKEKHIEPLEKGASTQQIMVGGKVVTPLVCSEVIFPSLASSKTSKFIINISNDSVFDDFLVAKQNHIMAKLRAVENGKYLLRSVKGGISSIIDPFGRVVEQSTRGSRDVLFGRILVTEK